MMLTDAPAASGNPRVHNGFGILTDGNPAAQLSALALRVR